MKFKSLVIAAAIALLTSLSPVAPIASLAPVAPAAAQAADAPAKGANPADQATPYGIQHMWENGTVVSRGILIVLVIMSAGSWDIFFTKWIDQQRILGQAQTVEKKFWTSASLK